MGPLPPLLLRVEVGGRPVILFDGRMGRPVPAVVNWFGVLVCELFLSFGVPLGLYGFAMVVFFLCVGERALSVECVNRTVCCRELVSRESCNLSVFVRAQLWFSGAAIGFGFGRWSNREGSIRRVRPCVCVSLIVFYKSCDRVCFRQWLNRRVCGWCALFWCALFGVLYRFSRALWSWELLCALVSVSGGRGCRWVQWPRTFDLYVVDTCCCLLY